MQLDSKVRITKPAISRFTEQVAEFLATGGVDQRAGHHVALVLDEMLTNLATHGDSAYETAEVRISIEPDSCVKQTENIFSRWGPPSLLVAKYIPGFSTVAPPKWRSRTSSITLGVAASTPSSSARPRSMRKGVPT